MSNGKAIVFEILVNGPEQGEQIDLAMHVVVEQCAAKGKQIKLNYGVRFMELDIIASDMNEIGDTIMLVALCLNDLRKNKLEARAMIFKTGNSYILNWKQKKGKERYFGTDSSTCCVVCLRDLDETSIDQDIFRGLPFSEKLYLNKWHNLDEMIDFWRVYSYIFDCCNMPDLKEVDWKKVLLQFKLNQSMGE